MKNKNTHYKNDCMQNKTNMSMPHNAKNGSNDDGPRFDVVLVARSNNKRPSEVEMRLRTSCQRMKIVEPQKLNGAHMIFTKESGLAIRVYYPEDLKRFDEALLKERPSTPEDIYRMLEKWHRGSGANDASQDDIDGLTAFRKHFGYAFVICVLPVNERSSYLDRPDSILHRIQRVMCSSDDNTYKSGRTSRVAVVPDAGTAVDALFAVAKALRPATRKKKKLFIEGFRKKEYIPDTSGIIHKPGNVKQKVAEVLHAWAREFGLPENEENMLMFDLESLGAIVTATDAQLESLPIESKTKAILHSFFGSQGSTDIIATDVRRSHNDTNSTFPSSEMMALRNSQPLLPMVHTANSSYQSPMAPMSQHPIANLRSMTDGPANYGSFPPQQQQQPMPVGRGGMLSSSSNARFQQNPRYYNPNNNAGYPPVQMAPSFGSNSQYQFQEQQAPNYHHQQQQQPGGFESSHGMVGGQFRNDQVSIQHQPLQMAQQGFHHQHQQYQQQSAPMGHAYDTSLQAPMQQQHHSHQYRAHNLQQQSQQQRRMGPSNGNFGGVRRFH